MNLDKIDIRFIKVCVGFIFPMFFFQNILIFYLFLKSNPTGFITISTNKHGEMILETIVSGLVLLLSFPTIIIALKWSFKTKNR